ncbi:MAG: hypothetical protein ACRCRP_02775 [Metamycoplasmataceae bacterium]
MYIQNPNINNNTFPQIVQKSFAQGISIDDKIISEKTDINITEIKFRNITSKIKLEKMKTDSGKFIYVINFEYGLTNKRDFFNFFLKVRTKQEGKSKWTEEHINLKDNGSTRIIPYFEANTNGEIEIELWAHLFSFWDWGQRLNIKCLNTTFKIEDKKNEYEKIILNPHDEVKLKKTKDVNVIISVNGKQSFKTEEEIIISIDKNFTNKNINKKVFQTNKYLKNNGIYLKKAAILNWGGGSNKELLLDKNDLNINSYTYIENDSNKVLEGVGPYSMKGLFVSPKFSGFLFPELLLEFEDVKTKLIIQGTIEIKKKLLDVNNGLVKFESNESDVNLEKQDLNGFKFFNPSLISQIIRQNNLTLNKLNEWAIKDEEAI